MVCRTRKPPERRGRVLFIDAVRQIARERAQSFLTPEHQKRILAAYDAFADEPGFAAVAPNDDVLANDGNLSILRYVPRIADADTDTQIGGDLREAWTDFDTGSEAFWSEIEDVVAMVERITISCSRRARLPRTGHRLTDDGSLRTLSRWCPLTGS